jgi:hypothetical protein
VNFVTLATVNNILKEAVEGSTAHVKYLFKDYAAEPEQEIMTFLSRVTDESKLFASVTEIERFANENGFSYDRKHVMEVLSSLKNKKLVKEGGEIRGEMYGFEIELLRLWIAEHVTIQRGFINPI